MLERVTRVGTGQPQAAQRAGRGGFAQALEAAIADASSLERQADSAVRALVLQEGTDIHSAVIASEKATLGLQLAISVRNKILEAYLEIMRMQV
jgi:flagellar hook-basal body complex protein FliE